MAWQRGSPIWCLVVVALVGALGSAAQADEPNPFNGQMLFSLCQSCHAMEGRAAKTGPTLAGLFGRRAGSVEGYAYSTAMRSLDLTWTDETLDRFLAKPRAVANGTTMLFSGLPKEQDRIDLIAYLHAVLDEKPR